jgi:DNA-binding transcriptional LysR family regulator
MDVTFPVLDVRKLIMLEAVMAEGSIAAAARRLQYTRSAVSQQLSALEAEAGTALIDRTGNHITLTPAGRALVEHAERILVELRSAEATLAGAGTRITGLLRVGIPFREGPHIMSRALTEVRRRFPDMELRLEVTSDEEGPEGVRRDQLDLAIVSRYGNARGEARAGLREWTLGHDPLRLCVPPDHPLADAPDCELTGLADEPWVMCPDTSLGRLVRSMAIAAFSPGWPRRCTMSAPPSAWSPWGGASPSLPSSPRPGRRGPSSGCPSGASTPSGTPS